MLSGIRRLSKSGSKKDATSDERLTFSITRADGTFGVGLSDSNYITSIEEGTPAAELGSASRSKSFIRYATVGILPRSSGPAISSRGAAAHAS